MKLIGKSQKQVEDEKARQSLVSEMNDLLALLSNTDWYISRKSETGKDIPEDVLTKREDARNRISVIRETI